MRGFFEDLFALLRALVLPFQLLPVFLWAAAALLLSAQSADRTAVLFLLFRCAEGFRAAGSMHGFFAAPASYGRFRTGCASGAHSDG